MKDTKDMKTAIVDEHYNVTTLTTCYINEGLDKKTRMRSETRDRQNHTREHARYVTGPILRRNAELARRRRDDGLTEYLQMKQYLEHRIYNRIATHFQQMRENMSMSSRKPFTTTAESCSTS
eukprot:1303152-Amphidinium_carterae.1